MKLTILHIKYNNFDFEMEKLQTNENKSKKSKNIVKRMCIVMIIGICLFATLKNNDFKDFLKANEGTISTIEKIVNISDKI